MGVIEAYEAALAPVRALDTEYREDETVEELEARWSVLSVDSGLVAPSFYATAILVYTPERADDPAVAHLFDALEPIRALERVPEVVRTFVEERPTAARESAEALAGELRDWVDVALETPAVADALRAYGKNAIRMNDPEQRAQALTAFREPENGSPKE